MLRSSENESPSWLKNFFLLSGKVFFYQPEPEDDPYLNSINQSNEYEATFETQTQFESLSSIVEKL